MKCGDEMGLLLSRYVDGELDDAEIARVDGHCAQCDECLKLLQFFQSNERMVADAVGNEGFGNRVLDGVTQKLEEETIPALPDRHIDWSRWVPAAAAVLLILAGAAFILPLSGQLEEMQETLASQKTLLNDQYDLFRDQATGEMKERKLLYRQLEQLAIDKYWDSMESPGNLFYIEDRAIRIQAAFSDSDQYESYALERREEGARDWDVVVSDLLSADARDETAKPGNIYWYRFAGLTPDGKRAESLPQRAMIPVQPGIDPRHNIKVDCIDIAREKGIARFRLTRHVNDNPRIWDFVVRTGEKVGTIREVAGYGEIDFSTALSLDALQEDEQTVVLDLIHTKHDQKGNLVERPDGTPVTWTERKVIAVRPNEKAVLTLPGRDEPVVIWKGSSVLIPLD